MVQFAGFAIAVVIFVAVVAAAAARFAALAPIHMRDKAPMKMLILFLLLAAADVAVLGK